MKILSWNVRGLGNPRAMRSVCLAMRQHNPQILFLCETKLTVAEADKLKFRLKMDNAVCVPCQGRKGGLIILWKDEVALSLKSFSKHHINMEVMEGGRCAWKLTDFLGGCTSESRKEGWDTLVALAERPSLPWLVFGDFNEVLDENEHLSNHQRSQSQIQDFRDTVNTCELKDLGYSSYKYTWCNRRHLEQNIKVRLDRAIGNEQWSNLFPEYRVTNLPFGSSDHCPILVDLSHRISQGGSGGGRPLYFEQMWLKHVDYSNIVNNSWKNGGSGPSAEWNSKIDDTRRSLSSWNRSTFGHVGRQIKDLQSRIHRAISDHSSPVDMNRIRALETELDAILEKEEIM